MTPAPPNPATARVTVAIACCNQSQFLGDAIESVLAQTRKVDEIIMVDDGSCDATAAVTARYPTVRYHYQDNAGLSAARNTGLALARCDYILFLDSDDILMPTAIAAALEAFMREPASAFVYGGYREVTEFRELMFERSAQQFDDAMTGLLLGNHVSMHGTVLYDARLLCEQGGFDTSLKSCEDYDVFLRLARGRPITAYPGIGADYRRHRNNMTGNHIRMMQTSRLVVKRHMALGGLTPDQRRAGERGLRFMTGYYSDAALVEIAWNIRRNLSLLLGGFRNDPLFLPRFIWFFLSRTGRAIGRRLPRPRSAPAE
jgi:Glycosyltransferases involved in cell wall biogenesis